MKLFHFLKKYGILKNNVNKKLERGILMILSCQNICKTFVEKPVLQNISFHLNENDRLAIIGYNGAGKSTLLKILIGEISYDEGEISLKTQALAILPNIKIIHSTIQFLMNFFPSKKKSLN